MKTQFLKEAKELNDLAAAGEASYRMFCLKLAALQRRVIDSGLVFKWWARDHLISPRTGKAWSDGTLKGHVSLGQKTDEQWKEIRARKNTKRVVNPQNVAHQAINQQVDTLMSIWELVAPEARRIFLDQVSRSGVRKAA